MLAHSYQVPPLTRGQLVKKANGWFSAGYLAGQEGALREALHPALLDKQRQGMLRYNTSASTPTTTKRGNNDDRSP